MKIKQLPHGTAFEERFTVTLRGEVSGNPLGWGTDIHEKNFLESELRDIVTQAIARYYQCDLRGTSLEVTL